MSHDRNHRRFGRLLLFTAFVLVILALEQLLQIWLVPTQSALAVNQLQAGDLATESLRTFEWGRSVLTTVAWGLIVVVGWAMFTPTSRLQVKQRRRMIA